VLEGVDVAYGLDPACGALEGHAERIRYATLRLREPVGAEVARDLADFLGEDRGVLDPLLVAIDDGWSRFLRMSWGVWCALMWFLPKRRGETSNGA
jgi:hypothetical protein